MNTTTTDPRPIIAEILALTQAITKLQESKRFALAQLDRLTGAQFRAVLASRNKDHGEATLEVAGHNVTMEVRKTIKWDQPRLKAAYTLFPDFRNSFKVELSISEAQFATIAKPITATDNMERFRNDIISARTVELSDPGYKIKPIE